MMSFSFLTTSNRRRYFFVLRVDFKGTLPRTFFSIFLSRQLQSDDKEGGMLPVHLTALISAF